MPEFEKGKSGNPAGRPKGSTVKFKYYDVRAACERLGHDPIEWAINVVKDEKVRYSIRQKANEGLVKRIAPELRSVEIKGDTENPVSFVFNMAPTIKKNIVDDDTE